MQNYDDDKARIRRLNEIGERLDGGGDNRPSVYTEGDTIIYRSSAIGKLCPRALWLARTGVDPSPTPDTLQKAFVESSNNEQLVLDMFADLHDVELSGLQEAFEIPVPGTNAVIRGHLDARGHATGQDGVVEVKSVSVNSWDKRGVNMYPGWLEQVQTQMKGTGTRLCWMVFGKKVDGVVDDIAFNVVEYDPRVIGRVFDQIREVEQAVENSVPLDCPEEKWGCPYWQLHEGTGDEEQVIDDKVLSGLATRIVSLAAQVRDADIALKEARDRVMEQLERLKLPSSVKVQGSDGRPLTVTVVTPSRTAWDTEALERDGINLDDYKVKNPGTPYVKIVKPKEK
jgi:CRISPR/Cas system-associated exonuclease Cas4 (RecB family)